MSTRPESSSGAAGTSKDVKYKRPRLTKAQLERKRKGDREAQRQLRIKTKNHVAHLENLVRSLQEAQEDNGCMVELVEQVKTGEKEINRLREIIRGVGRLVESVSESTALDSSLPSNEAPIATHRDRLETDIRPTIYNLPDAPINVAGNLESQLDRAPSPKDAPTAMTDLLAPESPKLLSCGPGSDDQLSQSPSVHVQVEKIKEYGSPSSSKESPGCLWLVGHGSEQLEITRKINTIAQEILHQRTLDGRLWYLAGSLLNYILSVPPSYQTPLEYDEDIPIRGVLHGWSAVAELYYLDPGWLWIRHLDDALYSSLGIPERLAITRMMRKTYHLQVRPYLTTTLKIPSFMIPRPAQQYIKHDPLIEYFVWPGVREHTLFAPRIYATNTFMESFRTHYRFMWPHNPEDVFIRQSVTGLYSYSSDFLQRVNSLRCWSMRSDFFSVYPDLRQDIPSFDESPDLSQILMPSMSPIWSRRLRHHDYDHSDKDGELTPPLPSEDFDSLCVGWPMERDLTLAISTKQSLS